MEWPLRDEASKDFDKLENVKIFFKDNMTANSHLKFIKNNILEWWDSTEVQNVKKYFKQKYARIDIDDRRREELYNLINNLNQNVS